MRDNQSTDTTQIHGTGKEEIIYSNRFSDAENSTRIHVWKVLCAKFFQRYVASTDRVLEIGAGDGGFIRHINAAHKIALDLSPHVAALKDFGVNEVIVAPATELVAHIHQPVDLIFMSNFLEHLPNKRMVLEVLTESIKVLKPKGKLLILQPNIRYTGVAYWDYIDHHIALTDTALIEGLIATGYQVTEVIPRFLPYTVRSSLGRITHRFNSDLILSIYLKLPLLWRLFGQQSFLVAERPADKP